MKKLITFSFFIFYCHNYPILFFSILMYDKFMFIMTKVCDCSDKSDFFKLVLLYNDGFIGPGDVGCGTIGQFR